MVSVLVIQNVKHHFEVRLMILILQTFRRADDVSNSILQSWRLSSLPLLLRSDCKTLTALSRLSGQPARPLCNLGSLQGPQGQGTLNTDKMCGVSAAHHPPPDWLNWGLRGFSGGLHGGEGGVGWEVGG